MVSALFFVSLAVADNAAASRAETKAFEATQEAGSGGAAETETKKEFWTKFAINLAKIISVISALLVLRFVVKTLGKRRENKEDATEDLEHRAAVQRRKS